MGVALEWEPWNWDLWDTPLEPDDDSAILELLRQKIDEALQMECESDTESQEKELPQPPRGVMMMWLGGGKDSIGGKSSAGGETRTPKGVIPEVFESQ